MATAGRCQSPMTSEEWQWILQDLSLQCHSSSSPEERQGRLHAGPFPAVSVDSSLACQTLQKNARLSGQLKAWETLSALLPASSKSK